MDKLSKEELLALLEKKPRKQRKPADLDAEKKAAMLDRLAAMRETVKKNREAKKSVMESPAVKEKEIDAVFEKKYGTKFDKMAELLTDLNENTKEVVKMKKEKAAKREGEGKTLGHPKPGDDGGVPRVKEPEAPPLANEGKPLGHPAPLAKGGFPVSQPTMGAPMSFPRNKGRTRW